MKIKATFTRFASTVFVALLLLTLTALPAIAQIDTTAGQALVDSLIHAQLSHSYTIGSWSLTIYQWLGILWAALELITRVIPGATPFTKWIWALLKKIDPKLNR